MLTFLILFVIILPVTLHCLIMQKVVFCSELRRASALVKKYADFCKKFSCSDHFNEYGKVKMLVAMLNEDTELKELVTISGIDEIYELSPGEVGKCRASLHFNASFGLHKKLWSKFPKGDEVIGIVVESLDDIFLGSKYLTYNFDMILHANFFVPYGGDQTRVPLKFSSAIVSFIKRVRRKLIFDLVLRRSPAPHRHAFRQVYHYSSSYCERFGPHCEPLSEDRRTNETRVIGSFGKLGELFVAAGAEGCFEYATFRDVFECSCGKEFLDEEVALV